MDKQEVKLEITADGSHTLYVPYLDEHYHSVNGSIQESLHVYITAGLHHILNKKEINILEVGFGTGLNAFLTLVNQASSATINYVASELYPLSSDIVRKINYPQYIPGGDAELFYKLHRAEWEIIQEITSTFFLKKVKTDFSNWSEDIALGLFDLIYFDAFAPEKQPEMWTQKLFDILYKHTSEKGVLVTYCAKGSVRRMLQNSGYQVERLPGPKGKREILRATRF